MWKAVPGAVLIGGPLTYEIASQMRGMFETFGDCHTRTHGSYWYRQCIVNFSKLVGKHRSEGRYLRGNLLRPIVKHF